MLKDNREKSTPLMRIKPWAQDLKSCFLTARPLYFEQKNAKVCYTKYSLFLLFSQAFAKLLLHEAKTFFSTKSFADPMNGKTK